MTENPVIRILWVKNYVFLPLWFRRQKRKWFVWKTKEVIGDFIDRRSGKVNDKPNDKLNCHMIRQQNKLFSLSNSSKKKIKKLEKKKLKKSSLPFSFSVLSNIQPYKRLPPLISQTDIRQEIRFFLIFTNLHFNFLFYFVLRSFLSRLPCILLREDLINWSHKSNK